ncbi:MAG: hypothetical protein RQ751_13460, partial [Longimicrobiales bacterium]|nr:hypothetical protein [Longimicrobiales bacterium]
MKRDPSAARPHSGGGTGAPRSRVRPLDAPHGVTVHADPHGNPVAVRVGRARLRVEAVRERWRIDDEWWRAPIHRVYHQVVLEDGRVATLYRDLVDGGWYLHGGRVASMRGTAPARRPAPPRRVDP